MTRDARCRGLDVSFQSCISKHRRCIWRGEGNRWGKGEWERCVEELYAPADEYYQLFNAAAAGAGDKV